MSDQLPLHNQDPSQNRENGNRSSLADVTVDILAAVDFLSLDGHDRRPDDFPSTEDYHAYLKTRRFMRGVEKPEAVFGGRWLQVGAKDVLDLEDGSRLRLGGYRTDNDSVGSHGYFDPEAPDAAYRLTFTRELTQNGDKTTVQAFSVEMAKQIDNGNPTLIVWDLERGEGYSSTYSGEAAVRRPEFTLLEKVAERLAAEKDSFIQLQADQMLQQE